MIEDEIKRLNSVSEDAQYAQNVQNAKDKAEKSLKDYFEWQAKAFKELSFFKNGLSYVLIAIFCIAVLEVFMAIFLNCRPLFFTFACGNLILIIIASWLKLSSYIIETKTKLKEKRMLLDLYYSRMLQVYSEYLAIGKPINFS